MDALSILVGFAENNAWANLRLYRACCALTQAELTAPGVSFFPTLRKTLSHNLTVDWYYVDALTHGTLGRKAFEEEEPFETAQAMAAAQREVDLRLVGLCQTLTAEELTAPVTLPRRDGPQVEETGRVLLHLFEHQIHHRGQAHALLAGTRVAPPQLDEFFLASEGPLRADELAELGLPVR